MGIFRIIAAFFLLFISLNGRSQIFPAEGDSLHYRIVGFRLPPMKKYLVRRIEVAIGTHYTEDSFRRHIIDTVTAKVNNAVITLPSFGTGYTWRVVYGRNEQMSIGVFNHFKTRVPPVLGSGESRLRVTRKSLKYTDAFVFLDNCRALYNMRGDMVWFLPEVDGLRNDVSIRDLKLSPQGTITFLAEAQAFEVDYDGKVLWNGPSTGKVSGEKQEHYHHELTRLKNGHYVVMGNKTQLCELPVSKNELPIILKTQVKPDNKAGNYRRIQFSTLIEYDKKGNVVWSWKLSDHYHNSHFNEYMKQMDVKEYDMHLNSFYFDEQQKVVYISSKNFGIVFKVKYPQGSVEDVYGSKYIPGDTGYADTLFCYQHCVRKSPLGYLYLFNNNLCNSGGAPEIVIFNEPKSKKEQLKVLWKYPCPLEGANYDKYIGANITSGGSVYELPDGEMLTSLCSPYAFTFIVSRQKEILWSAVPERWNGLEKKWNLLPQYRVSMITSAKQLEAVILSFSSRK